jgi:hypothetical protein
VSGLGPPEVERSHSSDVIVPQLWARPLDERAFPAVRPLRWRRHLFDLLGHEHRYRHQPGVGCCHLMAALAEYESDVNSDNARASYRKVMAQGRPPSAASESQPARPTSSTPAVLRSSGGCSVATSQGHPVDDCQGSNPLTGGGRAAPWTVAQVGRVLNNPAYAAWCPWTTSFVTTMSHFTSPKGAAGIPASDPRSIY